MERGIEITYDVLTKLSIIMNTSTKVLRNFLKEPELFIEAEFETIISLTNPDYKNIHFRLMQFQTGDMFQLREDVLVNKEILKSKDIFLMNSENYTVRKILDKFLIQSFVLKSLEEISVIVVNPQSNPNNLVTQIVFIL